MSAATKTSVLGSRIHQFLILFTAAHVFRPFGWVLSPEIRATFGQIFFVVWAPLNRSFLYQCKWGNFWISSLAKLGTTAIHKLLTVQEDQEFVLPPPNPWVSDLSYLNRLFQLALHFLDTPNSASFTMPQTLQKQHNMPQDLIGIAVLQTNVQRRNQGLVTAQTSLDLQPGRRHLFETGDQPISFKLHRYTVATSQNT